MNRKEVNRLAKERDKLISNLNFNLDEVVQKAQGTFMRMFIESFIDKLQRDESGTILNNLYNRNLLLSVDRIFKQFYGKSGEILGAAIAGGVSKVIDFNNRYYSNLTGNAKLLPIKNKVLENLKGWLGLDKSGKVNPNGYLDTIIGNTEFKNYIKNVSMKAVYGQQGWFDTKNNFAEFMGANASREELQEKDKVAGKFAQYFRNYTYDMYSQIDRATAITYADDLGFEFAIYEGGLIKTSREFCKDHNGKVYHKSEIADFKPEKAIPPNYNPFTDLGGYGCRHHLNWIPTALAIALRPDAKDFVKAA